MSEIPDEDTVLRLKRRTNSRIQIQRRILNFKSADQFFNTILDLISKQCWTRREIENMISDSSIVYSRGVRFLHEPVIISGTAKTDNEIYSALNLNKPTAKKTFDSELPVTKTKSMPTSEQFFKKKTEG